MPDGVQRFKTLIEPHLDALFRAAYRLARNRSDAEDLVQEVCVRAYDHVTELRESEPVKGWLLRVLHNVFVDGTRRTKRSPVTTRPEGSELDSCASPGPNPEESAYAAQREELLQRSWLKLERGHRALLALRAEGYTLDEISKITGHALDVLNARLYRARQSFARHLKEEQVSPAARKEVAR
jgi:RNA polymerase sigma-70 factor (ECF subfamily)